MSTIFTEANYENSVIELFRNDLGYEYVYGPDILLRMVRVAYSGIHKEVVSHFLWYSMHICCRKHWIVQR